MKSKHLQMYLRIAQAISLTSSCERLKVGAVIVKDNRVISTGYNALPTHMDGSCEDRVYCPQNYEYPTEEYPHLDDLRGIYKLVTKPEVRHGEKNALLNLTKSTESSQGSVLFCTHSCCKMCSVDIVDSGVKEVYYLHNYRDSSGIDYLKENGVKVQQIKLED